MTKALLRIGASLWRAACWPLTLPIALGGWAVVALLVKLGAFALPSGREGGIWPQLAAAGLLLITLVCLARLAQELWPAVAASSKRPRRERLLAEPPLPLAPREWAQRSLRLAGVRAQTHDREGAQVLFATRPLGQRLSRGLLYLGLAIAAARGTSLALAGQVESTGVLLLGQPISLGQSDLTATLSEVLVTTDADGDLVVQQALVSFQHGERTREVALAPGKGVVLGGLYVRLRETLAAAAVRAVQAGGRKLTVYPIDGAKPSANVARVWFTPIQQEQLIAVPPAALLVRLVRYADMDADTSELFAAVLDGESGAVLAEGEVEGATEFSVRGANLTIMPEVAIYISAQVLGVRVLWWLAGLLIILGLIAHLLWSRRQAWLAVAETGHIWLLDARVLPWDTRWLDHLIAVVALPD